MDGRNAGMASSSRSSKKEGRTAFTTGGYIRRFQTGEGGSVLFSFIGRRKPQGTLYIQGNKQLVRDRTAFS